MERIVTKNKIAGALLGLLLSISALAQTAKKPNEFYFKEANTSFYFIKFLEQNFSTEESQMASFSFLIFKIHGSGDITDVQYIGGLYKPVFAVVKSAILKSKPMWTTPKRDPKAYKWIVIPYYGGTYKQWKGNDLALSTYTSFEELNNRLKSDIQNMYMTLPLGGIGFEKAEE
ncbi:hypothetical protein [Aquirufa lenticrescens]|uniref:hypothetical protein n=1 Tax=Aquirufa lenticrescens TaxID=2696560 RepID=UPI001CAA72A9|nr:hypothetical protein [Aquirufa lenticrescens]UAJ14160.1 hypothetical protein G9X62_06130 [Aquirufa lenticrescens]